ncbi:glycoside hydrolase 15-related protein [Xylanimonas cellulosilytica DSM 15894]|uniref:Trehalase n=1 Tax=Xylanimonas cellulosilytica (strain DSM 15894 / JCM 12276 / CECT 5975 / KCTC 9989 / LMG 20990 / NBRC 107835 / XIL07) TaxID=446471 RepID=D1BXP3_XYLCX|nr:glycoside hydrolase family 15 protein [Xylanimonas cellulosilytica]ACZ31684.1 glycoside hydrolase 15-related protein [Xylanimonas cellulosilytica DSM 15894]
MSHEGTSSSHLAAPVGAGGAMTPEGRSPFPAIADYGFLSDCETNALVAPSGAVEWMCLPRPDSPSVFTALLDRGAGLFRVGPYGVRVPVARRYLPGTLVLETTWQTSTGWLVVRDAMLMGPWHHTASRSPTHRRTPTDDDAEHVLLRTVKCVSGAVDLEVMCEPRPSYGRDAARWEYDGDGYGTAVTRADGVPAADGASPPALRLTSSLRIGLGEGRATARSRMTEGDEHFVALSWSEQPAPGTWSDAVDAMWRTEQFWRGWITQGVFPDHPWRTHLQRSALTLKGLTYAPTGALLAAATTSLPETPHGPRNWDYRYSWIRDSTFALWGLYTLGLDREANDFFAFIQDVARDQLQVMYGVGGEQRLDESELDHLSGYEGALPVRIGNAAYAQAQHDVWGAVLDSVWVHAKSRDQLPESVWPLLQRQVEEAANHWREPDRGIWEVRGEPQHFTSSKLMCWVALDRGSRLARLYDEPDVADLWQKIAEEIRADICTHGVDDRGVFVQRYGSDALDASLLLVPLLRFLPPDDARVVATVHAIADELTDDGLVLRYRVDETDDGLDTREGAFAICSFWLVSALVEIGEVDRARSLCERLLGYASPLSLYAEQIDSATGRHLGNFPQAFTHLALINAVVHVIRAESVHGERFSFEAAHRPATGG